MNQAALKKKQKRAECKQTVIHQDCRKGMKDLADNSVSLVLTDPPYFIDGMDDCWNDDHLKKRAKNAGAIGGLPVGMKFDVKQGRRLQEFLYPVLKPGGFALCFSQPRLVGRAMVAMEDAGFEIRDLLAWRYEGQELSLQLNLLRGQA